jgi:hypothetical protein
MGCTYMPSSSFLAPLPGKKKTSARGVSQKYKKIVSFIVAFIYLLLVLLEWVLLKTPSCVALLAPKTMILSALLLRTYSRGKFL